MARSSSAWGPSCVLLHEDLDDNPGHRTVTPALRAGGLDLRTARPPSDLRQPGQGQQPGHGDPQQGYPQQGYPQQGYPQHKGIRSRGIRNRAIRSRGIPSSRGYGRSRATGSSIRDGYGAAGRPRGLRAAARLSRTSRARSQDAGWRDRGVDRDDVDRRRPQHHLPVPGDLRLKNPARMFEARCMTGVRLRRAPARASTSRPGDHRSVRSRAVVVPRAWRSSGARSWPRGFAGLINTGRSHRRGRRSARRARRFHQRRASARRSSRSSSRASPSSASSIFLRREFDGVVDGIIYATFCALGFAAVENIIYYAARRGAATRSPARSSCAASSRPWGHPLYTSMTGIGFGIAREIDKTWLRWLAPLGGYVRGVRCTRSGTSSRPCSDEAVLLPAPALVPLRARPSSGSSSALVVRKGRIIRTTSATRCSSATSAGGGRAHLLAGRPHQVHVLVARRAGRKFIRAGARLALSKWHTARAMKGQKRTISADFIIPMRQELKRLRGELMARMPR